MGTGKFSVTMTCILSIGLSFARCDSQLGVCRVICSFKTLVPLGKSHHVPSNVLMATAFLFEKVSRFIMVSAGSPSDATGQTGQPRKLAIVSLISASWEWPYFGPRLRAN